MKWLENIQCRTTISSFIKIDHIISAILHADGQAANT